jgi:hypothetical protein
MNSVDVKKIAQAEQSPYLSELTASPRRVLTEPAVALVVRAFYLGVEISRANCEIHCRYAESSSSEMGRFLGKLLRTNDNPSNTLAAHLPIK